MSNDIECFINMIFLTEYMNDLLYNDKDGIEKNKDIIFLLQDWNKYKNVQEIIELKNKHINNAIKEVLNNDFFLKKLREDTKIDINKINIK